MAEVAAVVNYINPLTVEASLFLNSLLRLSNASNCIDEALFGTLEQVVAAIDSFLKKQLTPVVATEKIKLVAVEEIAPIERIYNCIQCNLNLGKTPENAAAHLAYKHKTHKTEKQIHKLQSKMERRKERQAAKEVLSLKLPKKIKTMCSNVDSWLLDRVLVAEKLKQISDYDLIEAHLLALVKPLFPDESVRLYLFGSRIMGMACRSSDLDIFVDIGNTFHVFENRASKETLVHLHRVNEALRKTPKIWQRLICVDNARVPILKVSHAQTRIECDIGFSNSSGYCKTILMQHIFELQPMVRHMSIFLKLWFERTQLNKWISTFCMTMMVVYYMQVNRHLPSIEQMQLELPTLVHNGPWITNFMKKSLADLGLEMIELTPTNQTLFLQGFFQFYAYFDFSTCVVCPYFGRKTAIITIEEEMPARYLDFVKTHPSRKEASLELFKSMVVQDPIQLNHNVTKNMSALLTKKFIEHCRQTAELFLVTEPKSVAAI